MMGHQGIGVDGDQFVKKIKAEQIAGKGHAHGPDDGYGKAMVVAGLGVFVQGAHIADIVKGNQDPEERGDGGEKHPQGIHPEFKADARQDDEGGAFDHFSGQDLRGHGEDGQESRHGPQDGPGFPEIGLSLGGHDQDGGQGGDQDRHERFAGVNEFHGLGDAYPFSSLIPSTRISLNRR